MECRGRLSEGHRLSDSILPVFPVWRAFGPGASRLSAWVPPRKALPRTALRLVNGQGRHWTSHMARLRLGAAELGWGIAWLSESEPEITSWFSTTGMAICRMQLFPDALSVQLERVPDPFSYCRLLAQVHPLGDIRGSVNATLKGLLGDWDIRARDQAHESLADDVLLLWPDLTLAETTIAAIGLEVADKLLLPPVEGRVASITEAFELPGWAQSRRLIVQYRPIRLEEVSGGQLWCMNALRGLWQAGVVQL